MSQRYGTCRRWPQSLCSRIDARLAYYRRVFTAYLTARRSHLTFWHETPQLNNHFQVHELGEYYMLFTQKADYPGEYDEHGIPLLNYHGRVGLQYNPIAVAQYGLGNYNLYCRTGEPSRREHFLRSADWLVHRIERNSAGLWVWMHHFDWEYRTPIRAPWYSALSQGQGISLLVRAHKETGCATYGECAERALESFLRETSDGGVVTRDGDGQIWFEEAIVDPPTHILNGYLWALWGVYDHYLWSGSEDSRDLFAEAAQTLKQNLWRYDTGFWSLYELSGTRLPMLASPFYHSLHIVQLRVMHQLTGDDVFAHYASRWDGYRRTSVKRYAALALKAAFKLLYY